ARVPVPRGDGPAPPPDAFETALRLLTQRAHSEAELRRKLVRRRCPPDEIDRAVARTRRLGYLDDAAFARGLTDRRTRSGGRVLMAREWAAKGVGRGLVQQALDGVQGEDVRAAARGLAARAEAAGADRRVVAARLLRRGFPHDVVREAVG